MMGKILMSLALMCGAWAIQVQVHGFDSTQNTWSGYNPSCDHQCAQLNGTVCGTNVRLCCEPKQCESKLGFNVCKKALPQFKCEPEDKQKKLDELIRNLNSSAAK